MEKAGGVGMDIHQCNTMPEDFTRSWSDQKIYMRKDGVWEMVVVIPCGYENATSEIEIKYCPFCGKKLD